MTPPREPTSGADQATAAPSAGTNADRPAETAETQSASAAALWQLVESATERLLQRVAGLEQRLLEQTAELGRLQQQFAELGQAILSVQAGEAEERRVEQWTAAIRNVVGEALAQRPASRLGAFSAGGDRGGLVVQPARRRGASFDVSLDGAWHRQLALRAAMLVVVKHLCRKGIAPEAIAAASGRRNLFWSVDGVADARAFRQRSLAADHGSRSFAPARYFCREGELIASDGRTYALTSQWRAGDAKTLERLLGAFPSCGVVWRLSEEEMPGMAGRVATAAGQCDSMGLDGA